MTEASLEAIVKKQRDFFATNRSKEIDFRYEQLRRLKKAILAYESRINRALFQDLHKSNMESYSTEVGLCLAEISYVLKHLSAWTKDKKVKSPILFPGSKPFIYNEPYGIVLVISPWNYPFQLTVSPLIGAIAAGNCAILKPSEISPYISQVIQEMINEYFDDGYIAVVQGDSEVAKRLLLNRFDYIIYTGGGVVGKAVMRAAAENLTPITLELGGKSPCLVDSEADLDKAARRITWGKFLNAGQTCIAPDYMLVHKSVKSKLIDKIKVAIKDFYGEDPRQSPDYGRIINYRHFERLSEYIKEGDVIIGGNTLSLDRYISPTLIANVSPEMKMMQEEIFGPILPVLEYSEINDAFEFIKSRPKPLAIYVFSNNKGIQKRALKETSSGGVCINDVVVHFAVVELPYGGVGDSGFGKYHGKAGYELLSNKKSVMKQTTLFDLKFRYPPYRAATLSLIKKLLR